MCTPLQAQHLLQCNETELGQFQSNHWNKTITAMGPHLLCSDLNARSHLLY